MNFRFSFIYGNVSMDTFWFRFNNKKGIAFSRRPPLFSERNGYIKTRKLIFGWRCKKIF